MLNVKYKLDFMNVKENGEVTLLELFYFSSEKGSTLKGKNLLSLGANSFLLE